MRRVLAAAFALAALVLSLGGPALSGQQPAAQAPPRVGYVYPAGGQQGTTVRVVIGGQFLDGTSSTIISGTGVRATVVDHTKPLTARQLTGLRERAQALQPKAASDPAARQELLAIRAQIADTQQRNRNPVLSELVTLQIEIDTRAEPGPRELRVRTPFGLSTPLAFVVGQLPEVREPATPPDATTGDVALTLPVTVNGRLVPRDDESRQPIRQPGQYVPGDVDRFRFSARQGQHLVIAASARDLVPFLADAVPGWFQAVVTLYDTTGREVAFCDDYRFRPDPMLHYEVPVDGEYVLEIRDAIHRGRDDFVYRISLGELPFITRVFPLGGRAGEDIPIEIEGWNLHLTHVRVPRQSATGVVPVSITAGGIESNRVPFATDSLPETSEHEPNNGRADAQPVAAPLVINGRIQQPGDEDVFGFSGRAGETVVIEVMARRLESPLDSVAEIIGPDGRRVAFNDDSEDKGAGRLTHHADSYVVARLTTTGTHFLRVADAQRQGGAEYAYRVRLSAPRPDFELRVSPSAINVRGGTNLPVAVTVIRKDGFTGAVALSLEGAPAGTVVSGGVLPPGQNSVRITVTSPPITSRAPDRVRLEGRAAIAGREVVREARPADDRTQAFAYHHLVVATDLFLTVSGRGGSLVPPRVQSTQPVRIPLGGAAHIRVALPPAFRAVEHIQFDLSDPPDGVTLGSVADGERSFVIRADAGTAPGLRGNLIVLISGERVPRGEAQPAAGRRRVPLGALPAIPFEVVARK
jgi:hypothetical protein